ncbi:MAG TPA: SRPBCC domain-containing protein [Bacteroidia bacterium]|nr:SRPBCC domain-containing protein [Bacteroidia bacterium]
MSEKKFSLKLKYIVYASPDKVFEALTKSSIINKWSDSKGIVSEKTGGKFELFDGWVKGEVLIYKPGKKLSYTWKPAEWDKKTPPSIVIYSFNEHEAGTEIILEHKDFPSAEETAKHKDGWIDFVFEPLNDYFTS